METSEVKQQIEGLIDKHWKAIFARSLRRIAEENMLPSGHKMIIKCLVCGKTLKPLEPEKCDNVAPWDDLFSGGDAWEIDCNFGSRHDTNRYIFGLCDDCIEAKTKEGLLVHIGDTKGDWSDTLW